MSTRKLVSAALANLLIPLTGLLVSPLLSRELGPDGRGWYAALTLPIVVYGWLGTYGLQDALSYHLRQGQLSGRASVRVSLFATAPLGLLGVGLLAALGLGTFSGDRAHYGEFLVLTLFTPLHLLANLLIGALTGASDVTGVNLVKVVPALVRTALVVGCCLAFDLSPYAAGLLFVASTVAGIVPGLVRLGRLGRHGPVGAAGGAPAGEPRPALPTRSLLAYSLRCLPGVLAAISSARLDQVIGLPLIGARQLGYYAVAVSVAELPMVIATAARTVLMGRASSTDPRAATRVARLAVLASVVCCGLLAASAPVAVPLFFGAAFAPAVLPAAILCAGTTLYTCVVIFTAVLLADGRPGRSSAALVAGSLAGIALLLLLAPLGAVGAALASVAGYGLALAIAARAIGHTGRKVRMLTVPYADDLRSARDRLARGWAGLRSRTPGRPGTPRWARPLVAAMSGARPAPGPAVTGPAGPPSPTVDLATAGSALLLILAWLRIVLPGLVAMLATGRPEFNGQAATTPAADALGNVISLAFLVVAGALVVTGLWRRHGVPTARSRSATPPQPAAPAQADPTAQAADHTAQAEHTAQAGDAPPAGPATAVPAAQRQSTTAGGGAGRLDPDPAPARPAAGGPPAALARARAYLAGHHLAGHRLAGPASLAAVLAPLLAILASGLISGQPPGIVSIALPLAAVAVWLSPPRPSVLATIGLLGAASAAGSMLMAALRPDLALLSGAAAGAKSGTPGGLLAGPYPHSNVLGLSLALCAPFVLGIAGTALRRGSFAVTLLAVAWTGSRTAQLAILAVGCCHLLARRWPGRRWPLAVPAGLGAALIVAVPPLTRDPDGFTRRGRIWQALLERWADRPLLGWGPECFHRPDFVAALGGQFTHGHNAMVHLLVVGGLFTVVLVAVLCWLAWRRALALATAGAPAGALFLVALAHVSWLEASHLSTTLAGYLTWLPIALVVRLGQDRALPGPAGTAPAAVPAPAQKMSVSRR